MKLVPQTVGGTLILSFREGYFIELGLECQKAQLLPNLCQMYVTDSRDDNLEANLGQGHINFNSEDRDEFKNFLHSLHEMTKRIIRYVRDF